MTRTPNLQPLRLVPRRSPPLLRALVISLGALAASILARGLLLGADHAFGLSATLFPALIIATLYAGQRWGWTTLAAALLLGLTMRTPYPPGVSQQALVLTFALSGAVTVLVASVLRSSLVRLDEAQAALDRSERSLRLAQEAGGVGMWDWNLRTGDGHWSPRLYRNLGLDPSTPATLEQMFAAVHPDDREPVREIVRSAIENGQMDPFEYRAVWPDGQIRWLLTRGEVLRDHEGQVVRAVGVNIDVTDRRIAFEQVRESEARFRTLADSAPVLLWVSKTDGRREFVNQAYTDFLGVSYAEALDFDWRLRLHPDDLHRILKEQIAGESSRQLFVLEARYRRGDGEWRWIRSVSQPRQGPRGEFMGFIGIASDITDAKQAESDLKRINDLLAERVQAALAERDAAEAQLRHAQKLEAVGQLTGGVAHDFNNLLTVVIGALDLMQRHPNDLERRKRMIEAALGAARRGERLTNQLLAFSRRQALKPEPTRIDECVLAAEPLLRRAVGEAVEFTVTTNAADAVTMVDPSQLEAALLNLVVNARDAVCQGGSIRVETGPCRLGASDVAETEAGAYVCIGVHDTGSGMAPEVVARVFEPFFTTKEVGKGTGLGLSQVYGFARQSGGGVAVDSAVGKGTSVRLYLPLAPAGVVPAPTEPESAEIAAGPRLRILLVEDDREVGDLVGAMLEELGHQVQRASSVEGAITFLRGNEPIDLMLTDLIMPGALTGVDLAKAAVALRPALPVILSSGYTGETLSAAEGAPWPLLRKPYAADTLAKLIGEVIRERTPETT